VRVLLLDNYDSFAWNVVQALRTLGADVTVHRNDALTAAEAITHGADAIVLSPGPCTPAEAGISVDLVRAAAAERVPLLGICLGHQAIGVAFGGRVVRAERLVHGKTSRIRHDGEGIYAGIENPLTATRYHSLVVERPLPPGLVESAWSLPGPEDDHEELMGLRHRELPIAAVQFHPESYMTAAGSRLLGNFLALAQEGARL
jgi:anthranilate synthase/aminodeoxychorismate synthase-like glutamine amidotransferase